MYENLVQILGTVLLLETNTDNILHNNILFNLARALLTKTAFQFYAFALSMHMFLFLMQHYYLDWNGKISVSLVKLLNNLKSLQILPTQLEHSCSINSMFTSTHLKWSCNCGLSRVYGRFLPASNECPTLYTFQNVLNKWERCLNNHKFSTCDFCFSGIVSWKWNNNKKIYFKNIQGTLCRNITWQYSGGNGAAYIVSCVLCQSAWKQHKETLY